MKATVFEFTSYEFEPQQQRAVFHYRQHFADQEALDFTETIELPGAIPEGRVDSQLLEKLLQSLHLALGVSYYKFYCATELKYPYRFSEGEAVFWNAIYKEGLGEFYFRNKLDPNQAPTFSFDATAKLQSWRLEKTGKMLVALSGGKDSIVAAELLKGQGIDVTALFTETNRKTQLVDRVANALGVALVKIDRNLEVGKLKGHPYNGHIPISALYAFLGVFYGALYGFDAFVVANEFSSNFGNIRYKGMDINHQWSKSSRFEKLFADYVKNYLSPDISYFSLLRPFYEIRIAKLFAKHKKYFPLFSSCNKNFTLEGETHGLWCGQCPKCVFAWLLLSAFLSKKELVSIFKKNLYQDESLLPLFQDILGLGTMKPFDCVGTFEESKAAFVLGAKKFQSGAIVKTLQKKVKISQKEINQLFKTQINSLIPDHLKFLGMDNALILGYGKEGKVTKQYLKGRYPALKLGIADRKNGKKYLEVQEKFDIAVKTPGIKTSDMTTPYTTATNIFFSEMQQKGNMVIGVTGSKGKSTTASLIYAILKAAGKNAMLVGNIGQPMLETLLRPIAKDEIFVVELSSYQLEDVRYSPHIAVVTSLFPEHMDHHGGLKPYYEAKKNIVNFQHQGDTFLYNPKYKLLDSWAKASKSKSLAVAEKFTGQSQLIGEHNQGNISLAVAAVKELGVTDEVINRAIAEFQPLPHRLELVGEFKGIRFYDDANAATPEATIQAIKALKSVDTIFLGGEDRGYDFSQLEKVIKQFKIENAVLFPNSGNKIKLSGVNTLKTTSMEAAVRFAYRYTEPGKICLLSCASPSYSLWKNFEEKGDQFKHLVKKLNVKK